MALPVVGSNVPWQTGLAWHDHGWNGCICRNLKENTYCVGQFTFTGELITERLNLELEESLTGNPAGMEVS